jgi:hypothetical protein
VYKNKNRRKKQMATAKKTRSQLLVDIMNKTRTASEKDQYTFMVPLSKATALKLGKIAKTVRVEKGRIVH